MTNEQIIELANQAGITFITKSGVASATEEWLVEFARLVGNAKLESAAIKSWSCGMEWHMKRNNTDVREVGSAIAREIRSMKK